MKRFFSLLCGLGLTLCPVLAEEVQPQQDVEIKNSYLNVTSVNKKGDAEVQRVKIDKCFLSIIRINLGDKEVPIELKGEKDE